VTEWTTFAGFTGVVLALLLVLARASEAHLSTRPDPSDAVDADPDTDAPNAEIAGAEPPVGDAGRRDVPAVPEVSTVHDVPAVRDVPAVHDVPAVPEVSTQSLLLNVAFTQGLFACFLLLGVWLTEVPVAALGVDGPSAVPSNLVAGVALGVALYAANELGSAVSDRLGFGGEEALREALAPESAGGWALLLLLVLPVVAGFEELLFRGVLVGALSLGFGVSPWLLALLSSVAFALGHGAQGAGGVVVTGVLGFALAAAFVLTGSLVVVFVAHYLVNALAFVVHEGVGWESFG
jgi:membrane protease YdiL (CAAX protease family)